MSADEKTKSRCLLGSVIGLILLIIAMLITSIILKNGDTVPELSSAQALNHSDPKTSKPPIMARPISPDSQTTVIPKKSRNVCESPECITLAHQLHNFRDSSVDPCQDFFKYSCGNYIQHTVVEGTGMSKKSEILTNLIREFLIKKQPTTSRSEKAMITYFDKCEEVLNANDTKPFELVKWREVFDMIKKIGSWPVLDKNWKESEFNLNDMLVNMAKFGFEQFGFLEITASFDPFLSIRPLLSPMKMKYKPGKFEKKLKTILKDNKIQFDEHALKNDLNGFEVLENELAGFLINDDVSKLFTLEQLQKRIPSVDFERIIRSFMNTKNEDEIWRKVKDRLLISEQPLFFNETRNLETILTITPKRTLANFLIFRLIDLINIGPDKYCVEVVLKQFPLASLRVFVRNYFDKENLKIASDMVEDLRQSFKESFEKSTWLHEETKKKAIQKLEMMKKLVGYPEELEKPGALDKVFETLDISPSDSYHTMNIKIGRFQVEQNIDFVVGSIDIKAFDGVLWANAAYFNNINSLSVNVLLLDEPIFDSTFPKYAKIASAGRAIGHEMGHGFDSANRIKDGNGKVNDWWTPEDSKEYNKRAQCLVEQYENYDDPFYGKKFNGTTTLREIIADLIGNDVAWRSYRRLDMSNETKIIGFENENTDKVYFYISALTWCSARSTASLEEQLRRGHPQHIFRVNGMFSNMKPFAEAFNCPVGSPMNPVKKCELF